MNIIDNQTISFISAISFLLLVIATIVYVGFTYKLFSETKKLREVETSPFISLELSFFRDIERYSLMIKNIGKAPAYNITFEIEDKFIGIFKFNFKNTINYFSPNQEIEAIAIGIKYPFFETLRVNNIPIKVNYYSKDKIKYEEIFLIDWKLFEGLYSIDDNYLRKIETHLKNISNNIEKQTKIISK